MLQTLRNFFASPWIEYKDFKGIYEDMEIYCIQDKRFKKIGYFEDGHAYFTNDRYHIRVVTHFNNRREAALEVLKFYKESLG